MILFGRFIIFFIISFDFYLFLFIKYIDLFGDYFLVYCFNYFLS